MSKTFLLSIIASIFLIFLLSAAALWFINPVLSQKYSLVISPLPDFLTITKNKQVSSINLFLPEVKASMQSKNIGLSSKSAFIFDLTTDQPIFEKNIDKRLPMASLTKVMTAIISLENKKENDRYIVFKESLVGENSMGLSEGEILTLEELLYGLILRSGNDAAETLAENYKGGRSGFIKAMNDKAKSLGVKNTNFTNPSGLQGDGEQYATAYDLFVITNFAISNFSLFRKVASTFEYYIPANKNHKDFYLENETNLLTSYPGVKGVKTGYTPEAGLCLITYLDYKGHRIIGVILGSNNRRQEMKELLDYSLKVQGTTPPKHN